MYEPMALATIAIAPSRPREPPVAIVTVAAKSRGRVSRSETTPPLSPTACMMVVMPPPRVWTRKIRPIRPTTKPPHKGMRMCHGQGTRCAAERRFWPLPQNRFWKKEMMCAVATEAKPTASPTSGSSSRNVFSPGERFASCPQTSVRSFLAMFSNSVNIRVLLRRRRAASMFSGHGISGQKTGSTSNSTANSSRVSGRPTRK